MTLRQKVEELLKDGWYSNFQIQMFIKSSSADREARRVRENPPEGYEFKQRVKENSERHCYEYTLARICDANA